MNEAVGFELSRQQRAVVAGRVRPVVSLRASVDADLDAERVRARLAAFVRDHEALRSTLDRPAGFKLPVQNVHAELDVPVLSDVPAEDPIAALERLVDADAGPVLAAGLGTTGELALVACSVVADVPTLELALHAVTGTAEEAGDPIQYAEYAAWQQDRSAEGGEDARHAAEVWERLASETEPTALTDRGTPASGVAVPVEPSGSVDPDTWVAAWTVALARMTGLGSVVVGLELDPRVDPELAGAVGPYTQLVPMTVTVPSSGSVAEFAAALRRDRDDATAWFEWAPELHSGGTVVTVGALGARGARGDHQLELRVAPDGRSGLVRAGTDGSRELAETMARALTAVLASSADAIADADVLAADEVAELLGSSPQPAGRTPFVAALLDAATAHPDRPALTDGTTTLSYAELVARVTGLAAALIDAGAGPGAPVGVYLERSIDFLVAMIAGQRAGAGYLPLDVHQPAARTLRQLELTDVGVLVAHAAPEGFHGTLVDPGATGSATCPDPSIDDLAYVIFTSGSTGTPKGVAVGAGSLANYIAAIDGVAGPADGVRNWALVTSPITDLGNTAIFPALASGGTLHVVPQEAAQDPAAFAAYHAAHPLDVLKITPSHLDALLADKQADVLPRELLFVGGEAFSWQLADEIAARGACRVVNHYGPTETTVGALAFPVVAGTARTGRTVPIGFPLPGDEALVLDGRRRLVPAGAVGELAIGGAGVARGYVNAPDVTAERFVAHPYRDGATVYLTGDLARRDADGAVTFLGRSDGQVKIRGYRVERGEVEEALRAHPSVRRAAAVLRDDHGTGPQLVGYVVCQVNPSPTEQDLHEHLAQRLPDYMIPARVVTLDALPLRPNGKLDESALPPPPAAARRERVAPSGPTETALADIFATVLGVGDVGAEDDFFELGGHSLLATRIIVEIRSTLGVQLPVYSLFEAPTVRGLAGLVADATGGAGEVDDDELAAMIAELDELSDDEAAALLADGPEPGRNDRP